MSNLFVETPFIGHSGGYLPWKIECEALTEEDWACLAKLISKKHAFKEVVGIPEGGLPLARALEQYRRSDSHIVLIVDDVLTTGQSMDTEKRRIDYLPQNIFGIVVFARTTPPPWVRSIFQLGEGWCRHG